MEVVQAWLGKAMQVLSGSFGLLSLGIQPPCCDEGKARGETHIERTQSPGPDPQSQLCSWLTAPTYQPCEQAILKVDPPFTH